MLLSLTPEYKDCAGKIKIETVCVYEGKQKSVISCSPPWSHLRGLQGGCAPMSSLVREHGILRELGKG